MEIVDHDFGCARQPRDLRVHHPNRSAPDDQHRVAWSGARLLVGVVHTGHRLNQRRLFERDMVGNREHVALRHRVRRDPNKLGKCAVFMNSQCPVIRIQMSVPGHHEARPARVVVWRDTDPLAHRVTRDALAQFLNRARQLMSDHQRVLLGCVRVPVFEHPNIGPADACHRGAEQDFPGQDHRHRDVLNSKVVFSEESCGFHKEWRRGFR